MKEYKSLGALKKDLKKECKAYLTAFGTAYCEKAADELTKAAEIAIEAFYNDYSPTIYDRTGNLKENSYKRYYKNNGRQAWGGVYIGADFMKPYYKETRDGMVERDPFLVATTAWEGGLHGIYGFHTEEGNTGIVPIEIFNKKFKDKNFLKELDEVGELAAEKTIISGGIIDTFYRKK